jgi:hypothetical protein
MGGPVNVAEGAAGTGSTPSGASRVAVTGHVVARYGYRVPAFGSTAAVTLPAQAVTAGQAWSFAFDSTITGNGGTVRAGVDWYTWAGKKIAHADGSAVRVGSTWTRAAYAGTAPTGATRATITGTATLRAGTQWTSTACDFAGPAGATTPTPPPGGDGTQAATLLGRGSVVGGDEFEGTGAEHDEVGHVRRPRPRRERAATPVADSGRERPS